MTLLNSAVKIDHNEFMRATYQGFSPQEFDDATNSSVIIVVFFLGQQTQGGSFQLAKIGGLETEALLLNHYSGVDLTSLVFSSTSALVVTNDIVTYLPTSQDVVYNIYTAILTSVVKSGRWYVDPSIFRCP